MIELSVIAPCYNEVSNIRELVSRALGLFNKNAIIGEIILVNDGSDDGTDTEIERLSPKFKKRNIEIGKGRGRGEFDRYLYTQMSLELWYRIFIDNTRPVENG